MSITHIAFDLDGVLFTSEDFIADSYRAAVEKSGLNLPVPSKQKILKQFGMPGKVIIKNLFGDLSERDINNLREYLIQNIVKNVKSGGGCLYDGIETVLEILSHKYTLALCSNGNEDYLNAVLEYKKIKKYFLPLLTLNNTGCTNKPGLLKEYIIAAETEDRNWIMTGDRSSDLEAAQKNECYFIGCLWGFGDAAELEGADEVISKPPEILDAVKKIENLTFPG